MSHDRGCPCGREKHEYEDCQNALCRSKLTVPATPPDIDRRCACGRDPHEWGRCQKSHCIRNNVEDDMKDLTIDSGDSFIEHLAAVASDDVSGLIAAQRSYGNSWKQRGGVGAFMMLARKWDRLENRVSRQGTTASPYDIFSHVIDDQRAEGVIDDIRDLRRYLLLVEAELVARGFSADHRDNKRDA